MAAVNYDRAGAPTCGRTGFSRLATRASAVARDAGYIAHRSLLVDMKVLWLTVVNLIRREGIQGANGETPGFPLPDGGSTPSFAAAASSNDGGRS
jgi:hypothetical protein